MSAVHVIENAATRFPVGTSVAAYPLSNWAQGQLPPSGAPVGSSTESQTVASDGSLQYVALLPNTAYVAYAQVSGEDRYVRFKTQKYGRIAVATAASTGDKQIVAAAPGRRIVVEGYLLSTAGAVTLQWKSGTNVISGSLKYPDAGGVSHPDSGADRGDVGREPLRTRRGEALNLNQSAAVSTGGHVIYTLEPAR